MPALLTTLRTIPLFADLGDVALQQIADVSAIRTLPPGQVLYRAGERPECLFILRSGQINLGAGEGDDFATIDVLRPGNCFALSAVLLDRPYITTARTITAAELLCMPAAVLRAAAQTLPKLAQAMLTAAARQSRELMHQIGGLKRRSAAQRLGTFLLMLAEQQGTPGKIILPFDKRLLSSLLGVTPEHLSRSFATLRAYGVSTRGRTVMLAEMSRLAAFSRPDALAEQRGAEQPPLPPVSTTLAGPAVLPMG